jgi:hypothetical protein
MTHARDETASDDGVVVGSYEVLDSNCFVRKVTYKASKEAGFNVIDTATRPCSEEQRRYLEQGGRS